MPVSTHGLVRIRPAKYWPAWMESGQAPAVLWVTVHVGGAAPVQGCPKPTGGAGDKHIAQRCRVTHRSPANFRCGASTPQEKDGRLASFGTEGSETGPQKPDISRGPARNALSLRDVLVPGSLGLDHRMGHEDSLDHGSGHLPVPQPVSTGFVCVATGLNRWRAGRNDDQGRLPGF